MASIHSTKCCALDQLCASNNDMIKGGSKKKIFCSCGDPNCHYISAQSIMSCIRKSKKEGRHAMFCITRPDEEELVTKLQKLGFTQVSEFKRNRNDGILKMWLLTW